MRIVPLAEWYPEMLEAWLDPDVGRRLHVGVGGRRGYTVHHTGGGVEEELAYARWVAHFHFWTRNWRRPGGYNFQIGRRGTIFEMCGWEFVGAHAPTFNRSRIGVAFQGNFTHTLPNQLQLDSFAWLVREHSVPHDQNGHRDNGSGTACPGNTLHRALPLPIEIEPDEPDEPDEDDIMADPEIAKQLARLADASGVRAQADVSAELAAIRTRAGLAPEPDSDAVWIERIISGERTLAEAARAIADK